MKLTLKFAVLMLIPLAGLAFTGYVAFSALEELADFHTKQQAKLLMEAMAATRDYTKDHIKPKLSFESKDGKFNKETVPAFAARETLGYITGKDISNAGSPMSNTRWLDQWGYITGKDISNAGSHGDTSLSQYDYKEASDNPTNSLNKATPEEVEIIRRLSRQPSLEDTITREGKPYWYFARPIIAKESDGCMDCHSEKEKAPASMLRTYAENIGGFKWQEGVVAAQIVYVPKAVPDQIARSAAQKIAFIIFLAGAITLLALWWALVVLVTRPVARLSDMAEEISKGHVSTTQIPVKGNDEISQLTAAFNRMNQSLYKAVERLKGS
jgi:HAMP domain-containing protein